MEGSSSNGAKSKMRTCVICGGRVLTGKRYCWACRTNKPARDEYNNKPDGLERLPEFYEPELVDTLPLTLIKLGFWIVVAIIIWNYIK